MNDYRADAKKDGITDEIMTFGIPLQGGITAVRAYVVVPAGYEFKKNGKLVRETRSLHTNALQKSNAWRRITGWSWAER